MAELDLTDGTDPTGRDGDTTAGNVREILTWDLFGRATRDLATEARTAVLYRKPWSCQDPVVSAGNRDA